jgi:hypothetical protein
MDFIAVVVEPDPEEDFSALSMFLELAYGKVVRLLPNMWTFKSDRDVLDILDELEDFLFGHKAVCVKFDPILSLTDNMVELLN